MRNRLLTRPRGRLRRARGAVMLYFVLIALPLCMLGFSMVGDFASSIVAHRQVSNAAESAALAGAYQFQPGTMEVNPGDAVSAALDLYNTANAENVTRMATDEHPKVTVEDDNTTVVVTVDYRVPWLGFAKWFGAGENLQTVVRSASLCQSDSDIACAHPR